MNSQAGGQEQEQEQGHGQQTGSLALSGQVWLSRAVPDVTTTSALSGTLAAAKLSFIWVMCENPVTPHQIYTGIHIYIMVFIYGNAVINKYSGGLGQGAWRSYWPVSRFKPQPPCNPGSPLEYHWSAPGPFSYVHCFTFPDIGQGPTPALSHAIKATSWKCLPGGWRH